MNNDRASVTPLALADSLLKTAGHFPISRGRHEHQF